MCAPWDMEFRIKFDVHETGAWPGLFYAFEVLRDDTPAEALKRQKEAEAAKLEKDAADTEHVIELIKEEPQTCPRYISRGRIENLAPAGGWHCNKDAGVWEYRAEHHARITHPTHNRRVSDPKSSLRQRNPHAKLAREWSDVYSLTRSP